MAWRATWPADEFRRIAPTDRVGLWLAPGSHLVHYPIDGGTAINVVVIGAGEGASPSMDPFSGTPRTMIELLNDMAVWQRQSLLVQDASRSWTRGRVALVGDAAHAMAPSAAQGGAQAIEDAWVLAASLTAASPTNVASALSTYARLRQPRVERVAQLALRNLNIYEAKGISASARNTILRILPARFVLSQFDWLFGWKPQQN
jgi:salicylate hydroxylase